MSTVDSVLVNAALVFAQIARHLHQVNNPKVSSKGSYAGDCTRVILET